MKKENEALIAEVEFKLYKRHIYSVNHNFKNSSAEVYFLLCMIDKVLADVKDPNHKHSISTMTAKYLSNQRNDREDLNRFFSKYQKDIDPVQLSVFGVKFKLYKDESEYGTKFRIDSDYSSDKVANFDGKIAVSIMLYVIDLMKRFPVENQEFIAKAYSAMLQEYLDTGLPTKKTSGIAPVKAISRIVKSM